MTINNPDIDPVNQNIISEIPPSSRFERITEGTFDVIKGIGNDIKNAPLKAAVAVSLFGYTQKMDRARDPFVWLSDQATETLQQGSTEFIDGLGNSVKAGAEAGAIFGASYFAIGMAGYAATRAMPNATEQITTNAPRLEKVSRYATRGDNYPSKAALGLTIGTVAEGCLSGIDGVSAKEATKNVAKTSLAASSVLVPLVVAFDAVTDELVNRGHVDAATTIGDVITNRWTWLGLMVGAMAATYKQNTRIAKGEIK